MGENKYFAVVETDETLDKLITALTAAVEPYISIKTTPVMLYEDYARRILGVNPDILTQMKDPFTTTKRIMYIRSEIAHPGLEIFYLFYTIIYFTIIIMIWKYYILL